MFTAAKFITAPKHKQLQCGKSHTMDYLAINRKDVWSHATAYNEPWTHYAKWKKASNRRLHTVWSHCVKCPGEANPQGQEAPGQGPNGQCLLWGSHSNPSPHLQKPRLQVTQPAKSRETREDQGEVQEDTWRTAGWKRGQPRSSHILGAGQARTRSRSQSQQVHGNAPGWAQITKTLVGWGTVWLWKGVHVPFIQGVCIVLRI